MSLELKVLADPTALAVAAATRFLEHVSALQGNGTQPHVALTGGSIARLVHQQIAALASSSDVDWARVTFWWGDERFVAPDSADRNALAARQDLLDRLPGVRFHEIPSTADVPDVAAAADDYSSRWRAAGAGGFDLVMLGLGPDGHVASLFPGAAQLDVDDRIAVPVTDSPKPPPERVSLTFAALNRTHATWFLVSGEEKADAVRRTLAEEGDLHQTPARGIQPSPATSPATGTGTGTGTGQTVWFLDRPAASLL